MSTNPIACCTATSNAGTDRTVDSGPRYQELKGASTRSC